MDMSHQDWLEGQAEHHQLVERYERDRRSVRGVHFSHEQTGGEPILVIDLWCQRWTHDGAVMLAHAILSEVEGAQRDSETDARSVGVDP